MMRKFALAAAAVAALSTVAIAPAEARWRGGPGPAVAFGAVAGALNTIYLRVIPVLLVRSSRRARSSILCRQRSGLPDYCWGQRR